MTENKRTLITFIPIDRCPNAFTNEIFDQNEIIQPESTLVFIVSAYA